ncbi:MAG: beta-propeller domain-containing protein [Pseudomonadota bacterium]
MKIKFIIILLFLFFTASCNFPFLGNDDDNTDDTVGKTLGYKLSLLESCQDLENYYKDLLTKYVENEINRQIENGCDVEIYAEDTAELSGADTTSDDANESSDTQSRSSDSDNEYSETNTQVDGVDEADIFKTDGDYLYAIAGNSFRLLKAWPASETTELATYELEGEALEMFITDNKAIIFSNIYSYETSLGSEDIAYDYDNGGSSSSENTNEDISSLFENNYYVTKVTILDISNKESLSLTKELFYQGQYNTSRRISDNVYIVLEHSISTYDLGIDTYLSYWDYYDYDSNNCDTGSLSKDYEELRQENLDIIDALDITDFLPLYIEDNSEAALLTACNNIYKPQTPNSFGLFTIVSLDSSKSSDMQNTVSLIADADIVFMSENKLYIESSYAWYFWYYSLYSSFNDYSAIHEFELKSAEASVEYTASGEVEGYILNQFSMDEHDGYLRVATTTDRFTFWSWWDSQQADEEKKNHVFVLKNNGNGVLEKVGEINDIAPGEEIYAARFVEDKGFLVTFERTDPLFTIDLSDPTAPSLVGELEMPGYSTYLQAMDADHILAIGQVADNDGRLTGEIKLSIFDVSDFANPTIKAEEIIGTGWTYSEALYNHKAFSYFPTKNILAIPLYSWDYGSSDILSGIYVYNVTIENGFEEIGIISHADFISPPEDNCYTYYTLSPSRSHFIEDYIYTLSEGGIMVNQIDDIEFIISQSFEIPDSYFYCW